MTDGVAKFVEGDLCGGQEEGVPVSGVQGVGDVPQGGDVRLDQWCSSGQKAGWALGCAIQRDSEDGSEVIA